MKLVSIVLLCGASLSSSCNWISIDYVPKPAGLCIDSSYNIISGSRYSKAYLCDSESIMQEIDYRGDSCSTIRSTARYNLESSFASYDEYHSSNATLGHCDVSYDDGDNTTNFDDEQYICDYVRVQTDGYYIDEILTIAVGVCVSIAPESKMYGCNNQSLWEAWYSEEHCAGYVYHVDTTPLYDVESVEICTKITEMPQTCDDCGGGSDIAAPLKHCSLTPYLCVFVLTVISFCLNL